LNDRVQRRWLDRLTPTAAGLVSRAWVIDTVEAAGVPPAARARVIDELVAFEPPRRHGVRNTVIFWVGVIGAAMAAGAIGLPGWVGFVAALLVFAAIGRELARRAVRWRLDELMREGTDRPPRPAARP
jgi:hypothetical protein